MILISFLEIEEKLLQKLGPVIVQSVIGPVVPTSATIVSVAVLS
jgi:hypothetical protein